MVTGISTGALIAPLAFLGPKYDPQLKEFYTTLENRDVYRLHPVRGLLGESLADNAPLARLIEQNITPEVIAEVADAHRQGRRLYVGTTEVEGKRFVVWDLGAIACRNGPGRHGVDPPGPARLGGHPRVLPGGQDRRLG